MDIIEKHINKLLMTCKTRHYLKFSIKNSRSELRIKEWVKTKTKSNHFVSFEFMKFAQNTCKSHFNYKHYKLFIKSDKFVYYFNLIFSQFQRILIKYLHGFKIWGEVYYLFIYLFIMLLSLLILLFMLLLIMLLLMLLIFLFIIFIMLLNA